MTKNTRNVTNVTGESLREGDVLSPLEVLDLTVDGQGLARHQGRVLFLDDALPGAVVSAVVRRVRPNVLFGEVVETLKASPHEIPPDCPHTDECGACALRHFEPQALRDWKNRHLAQTLARIGKAPETPVLPALPASGAPAVRNKMSFAFGPGPDGRCLLGLRRRNGHEVVEVTRCPLLPDARAMEVLEEIRLLTADLGLEAWSGQGGRADRGGYLRHLVLHCPAYKDEGRAQLLVECVTGTDHQGRSREAGLTNAEAVRHVGERLMERFSLSGFIHSERAAAALLARGEKTVLVLGQDFFQESFGHVRLKAPHGAFMQTNSVAALALYECIERESGPGKTDTVWDLYCGIGGIGLFLARLAGRVYGCEADEAAVRAARQNCRDMGYDNCRFVRADLNKGLPKDLPPPDLVVLDPPRSGLPAALIEALLTVKARTLIYVSCDVGTQARDIRLLSPAWRPKASIPVDMFPLTPHDENVLVLHPVNA